MSRPTIRPDLAALEGYHSPQVQVDVRLNTNEAPAAPPPGFAKAVADAAVGIEWHRYPDRAATELRSALAGLHGEFGRSGKPIDVGNVFCANGSNEVLQTLLLTFAGPGRSVATFEPTYALHGHIARISGATTIEGERTNEFLIDPVAGPAWVRSNRPDVVFVCSPNNPTGIVEPRETIEALLAAVIDVGGLLIVDEAYGQFAPWSALELLGDDVPLVVTRTYSKTWAMAGARLGYVLAPAWLVDELDKVVLPYHLDAMKQAAGLAALDFIDDMEQRVADIVEERGRLQAALLEMGATVWPSGANFILFRPPNADGDRVWQAMVDRSVLVRNTASWDHLQGCLRVTVGTRTDNDRFLAALTEALA